MNITQFRARARLFVFKYISSTFKALENYVDKKFKRALSLTPYLLDYAVNNHKIPRKLH